MWLFFVGDSTQQRLAVTTINTLCGSPWHPENQSQLYSVHADWNVEVAPEVHVSFRFLRGFDLLKWRSIFGQDAQPFQTTLSYLDAQYFTKQHAGVHKRPLSIYHFQRDIRDTA